MAALTLASSSALFVGASHATLVSSSWPRRRQPTNGSFKPFRNELTVKETQRTDAAGAVSKLSRESVSRRVGGLVCTLLVATSIGTGLTAVAAALPPPASPITPYSQADRMQLGLVQGRIRPCPLDINPNCVSTSSNNAGYAAPWVIPESSYSNAVEKIETAILATQKNPEIVQVQDSREGTYLVAEADGFLGRDVMEFLVKNDVVTFRSMARKVVYLYPFTTPIGDFGAQQKRLDSLEKELGWSLPSYGNTFDDTSEYYWNNDM